MNDIEVPDDQFIPTGFFRNVAGFSEKSERGNNRCCPNEPRKRAPQMEMEPAFKFFCRFFQTNGQWPNQSSNRLRLADDILGILHGSSRRYRAEFSDVPPFPISQRLFRLRRFSHWISASLQTFLACWFG